MEKSFNRASRELFSAECPVSECNEGAPSNKYVEYKFYESYFNLLDRFSEFKPQLSAINKGYKVWSREFEIGGKKYTTKTLDFLTQHNYNDSGSFSTSYLPAGYIKAEKDDDVQYMQFTEFYESIRKNPEQLSKFDEAFAKAQKTDITNEYFSDLRIIFANSLSSIHAVAKDSSAFNQLFNIIGTYHPEISNFVFETYKSPAGLSQLLEHQAEITLEEREAQRRARPEALEDVLETSLLERLALAVKRGATTIPGLLVATASAVVAAHQNPDAHSEHHDTGKEIYSAQKDSVNINQNDSWEKLASYVNPPGLPGPSIICAGGEPLAITHDNEYINNKTVWYNTVWAYNIDECAWKNVSGKGANPGDKIINDAAYNPNISKVLCAVGGNWSYQSSGDLWAYDYSNYTFEKKGSNFPYIPCFGFACDLNHDKIITFRNKGQPYSGSYDLETWAYDYNNDSSSNRNAAGVPLDFLALKTGGILWDRIYYDSKNDKTILLVIDNHVPNPYLRVFAYDYTKNMWSEKGLNEGPTFTNIACAYDSTNGVLFAQSHAVNNSFETWIYNYKTDLWNKLNPAKQMPADSSISGYDVVHIPQRSAFVAFINNEVWGYNLNIPAPSLNKPTIVLSADEKLLPVTSEKILTPVVAGDDNDVTNNAKKFYADKSLFTAPDGKPILFNKKVSTADNDYDIFFLYWADNPSAIPALSHEHDWEYIAYKYDKTGNLLDVILSNHLETRKATAGEEIYIGQGGHEMTTNKAELWDPYVNFPRHFVDGGQKFKPGDYYVVNLDSIKDVNSVDAFGRYKADSAYWSFGGANEIFFNVLPAEQKEIAKDRAKVPWLQQLLQDPGKVFSQGSSNFVTAVYELQGNNADLEFRVIGNSVTGEDNGTVKAEIKNAGYIKFGQTKDVLAVWAPKEQFSKYKVEIHALNDSSYTIKVSMEDNGVLSTSEKSLDIKSGDTSIVGNPTPANSGPSSTDFTVILAAGAVGTVAALGGAYALQKRRKSKAESEEDHKPRRTRTKKSKIYEETEDEGLEEETEEKED